MENEKAKRKEGIKKYFIKTPPKPKYFWNLFWIIVSVFLSFLGVIMSEQSRQSDQAQSLIITGIGVFLLVISLTSFLAKRNKYRKAYNKAEPKPTDEQMDKWLEEGKVLVLKSAKQRLDIEDNDISSHPLMIEGPGNETFIAPGKDKILRYKEHDILLFFLTEHNISTFQCLLDLGKGEITEDRTKEFPYKDITSLETETMKSEYFYYIFGAKKKISELKTLGLFTSGGNNISINYFDLKDIKDDDDYKIPQSDAENTVKAIRKRLKEYKDKFSSGVQNFG